MSADAGAWVAYYTDWSGLRLFASEVDALRYAVDHGMAVLFVAWGEDPREVESRRWGHPAPPTARRDPYRSAGTEVAT